MSIRLLAVSTDAEIAAIASMAHTIWYEYYVPLIGRAQVDYMVERFQSAQAMQEQLRQGYQYFVVQRDTMPIGYTAVEPRTDGSLFISKLYLLREHRGGGTGRVVMTFIEEWAVQRGLGRLWLTVNKGNPAVKAYERLGFRMVEPIVMDIGGGFVMDDFRMEKVLV